MLTIGSTLIGKYVIKQRIGTGGMSTVYLADDITLGKQWAIKDINKNSNEFKADANQDGTLTEIEILKNIDSSIVPRIVDMAEDENSIYVVMDYVKGVNLRDYLIKYGPQSEENVSTWMIEVTKMLSYLHENGIIYRDMKPANIILTPSGEVRVIDFGIAKYKTQDGSDAVAKGTRGYAPPEQLNKHSDELSDIYALGMTLYFLLTGENPAAKTFVRRPLRSINPNISEGMEEIVMRCTNPDPKGRFKNAEEVINALLNYQKLEASYIDKLQKNIRIHKVIKTAGVICLSLGIAAMAAGGFLTVKEYKELVRVDALNAAERISSYQKAAELRPGVAESYLLLLEEYKEDGINQSEMEDLITRINSYENSFISKYKPTIGYAELNYQIGMSYLVNYSKVGISVKDRLLLAREYFARVSRVEKFDASSLASGLQRIASFYETGTSATKTDAEDLIRSMQTVIWESQGLFGKGVIRTNLTLYSIITDTLTEYYDSLINLGISKSSIEAIADTVSERLNGYNISPEDEDILAKAQRSSNNLISKINPEGGEQP